MADPTSKDETIKKRIIYHMNADHSDTIARYVEHHHHLSRFASRSATLTDLTLSSLTIAAAGRTYTIPLSPPMANLSESRPRLIQMDTEAIQFLNRSPITVTSYRAPRGFHAVVFAACLLTFALLSRHATTQPGSIFYDLVLRHVPSFAAFVAKVRLLILVPMVPLHTIEAWFMAQRMRKHSVRLFSKAWWMWVGSAFIEGIGSFQRLGALVEEQNVAKEKAKH